MSCILYVRHITTPLTSRDPAASAHTSGEWGVASEHATQTVSAVMTQLTPRFEHTIPHSVQMTEPPRPGSRTMKSRRSDVAPRLHRDNTETAHLSDSASRDRTHVDIVGQSSFQFILGTTRRKPILRQWLSNFQLHCEQATATSSWPRL